MRCDVSFTELIGKTITEITNNTYEIIFACSDGSEYKQIHHQDCCEHVNVEDICGDLNDLLNTPVLSAFESTNADDPPKPDADCKYLWTFYKIDTIKGGVTIRWFGSSNGYYGVSVNFDCIKEPDENCD